MSSNNRVEGENRVEASFGTRGVEGPRDAVGSEKVERAGIIGIAETTDVNKSDRKGPSVIVSGVWLPSPMGQGRQASGSVVGIPQGGGQRRGAHRHQERVLLTQIEDFGEPKGGGQSQHGGRHPSQESPECSCALETASALGHPA